MLNTTPQITDFANWLRDRAGAIVTDCDLVGRRVYTSRPKLRQAIAAGEWPPPARTLDGVQLWEGCVVLSALGFAPTIEQAEIEALIVNAAYGPVATTVVEAA
jgi:hypothetical protein